jgi:PAS domain S-box-containing protein
MRLRVYLVVLVLAVTVPLFAIAVLAAFDIATAYRRTTDTDLMNTTHALSLAIGSHVDAVIGRAEALAASPTLDDGDLGAFYRHAHRVGDAGRGWVVLNDLTDRELVNTRVPFGTPLPQGAASDVAARVIATGKPLVTDLFVGAIVDRLILSAVVPVNREGRTVYTLWMAIEPAELSRLLTDQRLSDGAYASLWDSRGRIVARSGEDATNLGRAIPDSTRPRQGIARAVGLDGQPVVMAIDPVPHTGWSIGIAAPPASPTRVLLHPLALLLLSAGSAILSGTLLAIVLGRFLLRPVNALAASSIAVARGEEAAVVGPFRIAEFERLREALARASLALREEARAQALTVANAELERRVAERTQALADATEKLREGEARFRAYVENSPDVLFIVRVMAGGDFVFEDINGAAERLSGQSAANMIGKRPTESLPPDVAATAMEHWRQCVETGAPVQWEQRIDLATGRRLFETILVPARDESGRIVRLFGSARDVTERREMEARLYRAERLEALGRLTSGLAHDFNNLLTGIGGNLERIAAKADQEARVRRHAASALLGIGRGARLIATMLAFARQQTPQVAIHDVNAALRDFEGLARSAITQPIKLTFDLEPVARHCRADLAQLESAILNLIVNAADAMPDGGRVTVRTRPVAPRLDELPAGAAIAGPFLAISVVDTGPGMPPDIAARAFEPFFTTKREGKGTGLGLSQVLDFARQAGGTARIDSAVGQGTTVTIFLPCTTEPSEPALPETPGGKPAASPDEE